MEKYVGQRMKRKEDPRLLMGKGLYVDDVTLPRMIHGRILRSPHAYAKIKKIDTSEAKKLPGVLDVLTGREAATLAKPYSIFFSVPGLEKDPQERCLAVDRVLYSGEGIAAVAAIDEYAAEDALELIDVEYETMEPILDPEDAIKSDTPMIFEGWGTNVYYHHRINSGNVNKAFSNADKIFKEKFTFHRYTATPIETYGCVADYNSAVGALTVWCNNQMPFFVRSLLSSTLNIPEGRVKVLVPDVGGAFGIKCHIFPYELLASILSLRTGRPVKMIEDRREHMMASRHGPARVSYVEVALKKDGTILGWKERVIQDEGAYPGWGPSILALSIWQTPGPYKIPNIRIDGYCVVTNKCPIGAVRGFGDPNVTFVRERILDIIAEGLQIDPAELRLKNMVQPDEFPYTTSTGQIYDTGSFVECMKEAMKRADYEKFKVNKKPFVGIGLANQTERSSVRPVPHHFDAEFETITVRVEPMGTISIFTGTVSQGQGHETTLAQIAADQFAIDPAKVEVIHGDTDAVNYGLGTYGSRTIVIAGNALIGAARLVKDKMVKIAAHILRSKISDMAFVNGRMADRSNPEKSLTFEEIADVALTNTTRLPPGVSPGLEASYTYEPPVSGWDKDGCGNPSITYSNATHLAIVEVDPETGLVKILKYIVVEDCGIPINPMIVEGQIHGGVAHGIGGALYENLVYDSGGQLLSATFMDYLVPTAMEIPEIEAYHIVKPSKTSPGGFKGVGESGAVGPPAAIANAVSNAVKMKITDLPLTPESVLNLIKKRGTSSK